eukprot:gene6663-7415_t
MAAKSETSWEDPQHSNAKRVILKKHLQAYIPIMCEAFHKINILDCFAGPGEFFQESKQEEQDEEIVLPPKEKGSPLVALDAGIGYFRSKRGKSYRGETRIYFYFCEERKDRLESLKQNVCENLNAQNVKYSQDPSSGDITAIFNIRQSILIHFYKSKFEFLQMDEIMCRDWPTFFFIDPFGYSQIPFDAVSKLCEWEKSEILINLMVQPVQRTIGRGQLPEYERQVNAKLTAILGTDDWIRQKEQGKLDFDKIVEIYSDRVKETQMKYTLHFTMKNNQNVRLYSLIYATKHLKGIETMKESMNRVTQEEDQLSFSSFSINKGHIEWKGWKNNQDEEEAAEQIYARFRGQTILTKMKNSHEKRMNFYEESIEGFILLNTPFVFRADQVKKLFNEGKVKVNFNFGSNRGTFKEGKVAFMAKDERFQLPEFVKLLNKYCKKERDLCNLSENFHSFDCINRIFKHTALSVDARDGSEVKLDKYLKEGSVKEQISCNRSNSHNHKEGCLLKYPSTEPEEPQEELEIVQERLPTSCLKIR